MEDIFSPLTVQNRTFRLFIYLFMVRIEFQPLTYPIHTTLGIDQLNDAKNLFWKLFFQLQRKSIHPSI